MTESSGASGGDAPTPEVALDALRRFRDEPPPGEPGSGGCALAIVALLGIVLMPFAGQAFDLAGPVMGAFGGVLLLVAVGGAVMGMRGPGRVRARAAATADARASAITSPDTPAEARLDAAVRLLADAFVTIGPTTTEAFDRDRVAARLGDALPYVYAVERALLEAEEIYPVFTARSSPERSE